MIYVTNKNLPKEYKNDCGLSLCKLWFATLWGEDITNIKKLDISRIKITEIPQYKLVKNEILLIGNTYCVGDGFGNVIYCPYRENEDLIKFKEGWLQIKEKYEVTDDRAE